MPCSVRYPEGRQPGLQRHLRVDLRRGAQRVGVMEGQEGNAWKAILLGYTCHWRNLGLEGACLIHVKGGATPEARIRRKRLGFALLCVLAPLVTGLIPLGPSRTPLALRMHLYRVVQRLLGANVVE